MCVLNVTSGERNSCRCRKFVDFAKEYQGHLLETVPCKDYPEEKWGLMDGKNNMRWPVAGLLFGGEKVILRPYLLHNSV